LPANPYYCAIDPDSPEALERKPGAFFYGPVSYDPNVVATLEPAWDMRAQRYKSDKAGKIVFDVNFALPAGAFLRTTPIGTLVQPYEELVALAGKMRPVVILSPTAANKETMLVLPSFKADNFPPETVEAAKKGKAMQYFYLPACPELNVLPSMLPFQRIQPMRMDAKLVNAGNRKQDDPDRRHLRLTDDYLAALRQALSAYLGIA
jgi:hypothetical protein